MVVIFVDLRAAFDLMDRGGIDRDDEKEGD